MKKQSIYIKILVYLFLLSSCSQKKGTELEKLSTAETVKLLKEGKINQFKFIYRDSVGNELTPELSKKFSRGEMIREFYVNQLNEIVQVRLFDYSHDKVFHEILIRELLNDPFKSYQFIDVNCDQSDALMKQVLAKDQKVRKKGSNGKSIIETDASNQQIVNSIIKKCDWPYDPELITSI